MPVACELRQLATIQRWRARTIIFQPLSGWHDNTSAAQRRTTIILQPLSGCYFGPVPAHVGPAVLRMEYAHRVKQMCAPPHSCVTPAIRHQHLFGDSPMTPGVYSDAGVYGAAGGVYVMVVNGIIVAGADVVGGGGTDRQTD